MKQNSIDSTGMFVSDDHRWTTSFHLQGFFPNRLDAVISDTIADATSQYFFHYADMDWNKIRSSGDRYTEILEVEFDCGPVADFVEEIRYINVKGYPDEMRWAVMIHLEEASAPCVITILIREVDEHE